MGNHTATRARGRTSSRTATPSRGPETPEDRAYAAAKAESRRAQSALARAQKAADAARQDAHRAAFAVGNAHTTARVDIRTRTAEEAGRTRAPVAYARYTAAKGALPDAEHAYRAAGDHRAATNNKILDLFTKIDHTLPFAEHEAAARAVRRSEEYKALQRQLTEAEKAEKTASKPYFNARNVVDSFLARYGGAWATSEQEEAHPAVRSARAAEDRANRTDARAQMRLAEATGRHERAQGAERLASGAADRSHGGPGIFTQFGTREAERDWRTLLGDRATSETLRRITGAQEGDDIHISTASDRGNSRNIGVNIYREGGRAEAGYTLWRVNDAADAQQMGVPRGSLVMNVGSVASGTKTAGSGRDLINAFSALRDLGVQQITASAARGPDANGYYTWAQIGGQGRIPAGVAPAARARFGAGTTRVEQIVDKPGGLAWWREHGDTFPVTLDLSPGGRTSRFLESYESIIRQRASRGGSAA